MELRAIAYPSELANHGTNFARKYRLRGSTCKEDPTPQSQCTFAAISGYLGLLSDRDVHGTYSSGLLAGFGGHLQPGKAKICKDKLFPSPRGGRNKERRLHCMQIRIGPQLRKIRRPGCYG